ncbi:bacteriophage CI repressor [Salmonella enterica subsp. enterica serovar Give]|uniref:helix-turn-helix domain-containing protein n=1 Tax=Salmonella enterica TaxID=28901 RepID=UPI0009B128B6|nr:helix-turn-helix domain-containing protein [Salmonella enterica]ECA5181061.1 XRE family transcriptional regulator [Salmonella enterica subsp. enterica serovar Newport]ECI2789206.1 bacteriophage CI repressor [Salmonella enterica subsp. enterica serovar Give]EEC4933367.1 bacteriophage CI repressor [Salmonella enterica subsp. enterica serovar Kasenyi]EGZ3888790.1 bacteriophage CI repressor [Salmonella enterica subsp. enterica serovar Bonn]EIC3510038.1 helix-turn-helix domain-containing protein
MNHIVKGKERNDEKESVFSFPAFQKESIKERLTKLMRGRSKTAVAKAWGLPFSTLNNYFEKDATPSLQVASQIAFAEGVSIDWLVFGRGATESSQPQSDANIQHQPPDITQQRLLAILSALESPEAERLSKLLALNGAKYLSRLLEPENQELIRLEGRKRAAALLLDSLPDERVREILAEIEASILSESVKAKAG